MCIYFGSSPQLTYSSQEHVFPAGLGGKQKLEKGVVSDQANALFSPMEMKLMRQSFVSLDRMFFGPGDRGSLLPEKASKSQISVGCNDAGEPFLCYISAGETHKIPQFRTDGEMVFALLPNTAANDDLAIKQFLEHLRCFNEKFVYLISNLVPKDHIIIGFSDEKYYVATSDERPSQQRIIAAINLLKEKVDSGCKKQTHTQTAKSSTELKISLMHDDEIDRIYAKTAMNTLALIKGVDYALSPNFDDIRKWIISGESKENYSGLPLMLSSPDNNQHFTHIMPADSHWCIFVEAQSKLIATVCFYNHTIRQFLFGNITGCDCASPFGFICDWKNEKEYSLDQYLKKYVVPDNSEKNET